MKYNLKKKNIISSTLERVTPQFVNRFIVLHIISNKYLEFEFIINLIKKDFFN